MAAWHDHRLILLELAIVGIFLILLVKYKQRHLRHNSDQRDDHNSSSFAALEKSSWSPKSYEKPKSEFVSECRTAASEDYVRKAPSISEEHLSSSRVAPKRLKGVKTEKSVKAQEQERSSVHPDRRLVLKPLVFFSSLGGITKVYAEKVVNDLSNSCSSSLLKPQIFDLSNIDYEDFFLTAPKLAECASGISYIYLILLPTYDIDTYLDTFLIHLRETHHDFRIDTAPLSALAGYSVFGLGDKEGWPNEEGGFCSQAKEVDKWMAKLTGRKRAFPLGMGDIKSDSLIRLHEWKAGVEEVLQQILSHGGLGEGIQGSGEAIESDEEELEGDQVEINTQAPNEENQPRTPPRRRKFVKKSNVDDLEDLGMKVPLDAIDSSESADPSLLAIDFTTSNSTSKLTTLPKEMVPKSSPTHAALTKQGYAIIGSHSGIKICRWTKSALRGRGSCYKYSFYGIKSHLCMETTPSLSCSNKCVFCWRHGTNPVGTTWRWQVDPPEMIFEGAREAHLKKIKMMRGVPGVRAERFQEAMKIRHCALSLVGEPIFYPHINEFVSLLHRDRISSFLVCNAQHPEQLDALKVVTQLYVSIDASNRDSLRKVDRPLHRDFWERFIRCLDILREKRFRMRTVFRLTLVKGFNIDDEIEGYADLVARGLPCFVEVKGVTYCGTSSSAGAGLTMQNVPFYEEVSAFVTALNEALEKRGLDYGIAAEHAHSCCVLMASRRFFIEGKWHTLIDYDTFFKCLESGKEFAPEDYVGPPTPEWAIWGHGGFDPADERVYRKGKNKHAQDATANSAVMEDVQEGAVVSPTLITNS